jgi:hypothetical protein
MSDEAIEKGIIISGPRKVIRVGGSKAITLDPQWLKIQKWLGQEVTELVSVANSVIVFVPPEKTEIAKKIIRQIETEIHESEETDELEAG